MAAAGWLTPTVLSMARRAHDLRPGSDFLDSQALLDLADAMEAAGCNNVFLLGHLRDRNEFAVRCWVADLVLGCLRQES